MKLTPPLILNPRDIFSFSGAYLPFLHSQTLKILTNTSRYASRLAAGTVFCNTTPLGLHPRASCVHRARLHALGPPPPRTRFDQMRMRSPFINRGRMHVHKAQRLLLVRLCSCTRSTTLCPCRCAYSKANVAS